MNGFWLKEIISAMKDLGGDSNYEDLYNEIVKRGNIKLDNRKYWRQRVRATIEEFSSDSQTYNGKKDIFFSIDGIGRGHWGLRNYLPTEKSVSLTKDDISYPEGKKILRQHICRERNPKVILEAKKLFKEKHNGKLFCEACGFSFTDTYGELGENFIEGSHKIPVSMLSAADETRPEDIIMLCSNCHRMIHRLKFSPDSLEQLKKIISNNSKSKKAL